MPKTAAIHLRLTKEEKEKVERVCKKQCRSISNFVLMLIRKELAREVQ